ncbi:MAG: polysaccharide deacetylase family protein [Muribaculaceae bacterium]|nr:polysaccharide deacetylase family protein [Muribaculaceae bacterium]
MKSRFLIMSVLAVTAVCMAALPPARPVPLVDERFDRSGCTVGAPTGSRAIHLIFTADSMFEGAPFALDCLDARDIKASFFFTGNFLRDRANDSIVNRVIKAGHYVGPHGDRHILLADWDDNRTPLVTPDSAVRDMHDNYVELKRFGVERNDAPTIVPPYEWYNRIHIDAYRADGLKPVSPSPGIETFRDYTTPDMPDYRGSDYLWNQLFEREKSHGLDGAIMILHLGTQDVRTDKFYHRLPALLDTLTALGYTFERF